MGVCTGAWRAYNNNKLGLSLTFMSTSPPSIEDLDKRVTYLEIIEGIRQECPPGQRWDDDANKCVDLPPLPPLPPADPDKPPTDEIPIVDSQSSGVDGANVPANAYDNNPATRFSVKGLGSWISLDLGAVQEVHLIQFVWYMQVGETRTNVVTLEFSDQAGATPSATGPSLTEHTNHGKVISVADFGDAPKQARSIVVKLSSTTNAGQWFSITDIKITGKILNPVVTPTPTPPTPAPQPPTPTPGGDIGKDGVKMIYPTAMGGTEFYLNIDDPYKQGSGYQDHGQFNVSYGSGSQFPITKHTEGSLTFYNTEGSPISYASGGKSGRSTRLDVYPDGGKWANKTKYYWKDNPGYLYTDHGIGSGEFTIFIRTHGDLGTHQAYACKIGGRDEDDLRSLIEMVYPTATHNDVQVNVNYAHFPYVNCKPKILLAPPKLVADKWVGVKCVHKIAADKKSGDWELWFDDTPFDATTGKIANNWRLAATYHDVGVKGYDNVPLTWKCHKDLCRVDGFKNVDFTLISDREIQVGGAVPEPTPTPPEPQPPTPEPTPIPEPGAEHIDAFGVQMIYASAAPPVNNWAFTSVDDPRFYEQHPKVVSGSGKDAWLTYPSLNQGRIEVLPDDAKIVGSLDDNIDTYHYEKVIGKGYLRKPRNSTDGKGDWGDIEITAAYRNVQPGSGSFESHAEIVRGGGKQTTDSTKCGKDKAVERSCEAMSYHNGVYPPPGTDRAKFEKDTKHTQGYTAHDPEFKSVFSKNKIDQKAGYVHKFVAYRVPDSSVHGGFAMKLESYASIDGLDGKKFVLLGEFLDKGQWGPSKGMVCKTCGCPDEYPVHSMDVLCPGWRIDFMKSFEFSKLSIRSIDPSKKLI